MSPSLRSTDRPLAELYDVALLDLDGVVYVGPDAVPGVPQALTAAREAGMQLAFVTNNAARPPLVVAEHLTRLGVQAQAAEVINSAQAAARYLSDHLAAGSEVLVLGTTGLIEALLERRLTPVHEAGETVRAVVQGYSPDMNWALLAEGAVAIGAGALWVATNVDPTVPSPRGPLPGNGALVAALRLATRLEPVITGKPDPTMHRETVLRTGARDPIVVGDRLDTDIEGASAVGCASLLVFSGVTTVRDLLAAPVALRPDYLAQDASGLLHAHAAPIIEGSTARCGRWLVSTADAGLTLDVVEGADEVTDSDALPDATGFTTQELDAVRALCGAHWQHGDGALEPTVVRAGHGSGARETLDRLGLQAR